MKIEDMIGAYIKLRDKKQADEKAHKTRMAKLTALMREIEDRIQAHFNETGASSIRTSCGTAYSTVRLSARVDDQEAFRQFVESQGAWGILEARANKSAVAEYLDEHGEPPPGVSITRAHNININRG